MLSFTKKTTNMLLFSIYYNSLKHSKTLVLSFLFNLHCFSNNIVFTCDLNKCSSLNKCFLNLIKK